MSLRLLNAIIRQLEAEGESLELVRLRLERVTILHDNMVRSGELRWTTRKRNTIAKIQNMMLVSRGGKSESECWLWPFHLTAKGYGGSVLIGDKHIPAHRLAVILDGRTIPKGMLVCHHCDVPRCVNPKHLYVGTDQNNVDDKMCRGRYRCLHDEDNWNTKLSIEDVGCIVSAKRNGATLQEIADAFGVARNTVKEINRGGYRKHALKTLGLYELVCR